MRSLVWVRAGLIAAGFSVALLLGAAAANAETGAGAGPSGGPPSQSNDSGANKSESGPKADNGPHDLGASPHLKLASPTDGAGNGASGLAGADPTSGENPSNAQRAALSRGSRLAVFTQSHRPTVSPRELSSAPEAAPPGGVAEAARVVPDPKPTIQSPVKTVGSLITGVIAEVGSVSINAVQAVEAAVTGPPILPANSSVTVKSSTLRLSNGQAVPANWYYPETKDGAPPEHLILLQHGFFALGPMYSYTAADLAEQTNSVVVTPTLSSNPLAGDAYWLGGTGMSESIADLFVGSRTDLTASAVAAGYASQYDLDPATAKLPQKFALEGHSLGANLVSGTAGALVDKGAADDLVGVILLDGVPSGDTLPIALKKLDAYAVKPGGHYIPVREIGAPFNLFNSVSTVNDDLSDARPFRFNGVVLDGGVHTDSMRGGNPLIQFVTYVVAGFPQPQNALAVDQLSATWLNEWFAGATGIGDGLPPGSAIDIVTPAGTAHGVVIGSSQPYSFATGSGSRASLGNPLSTL